MNPRNILILAVILAALAGAYYYVSRPEPAPPPEPKLYVWMFEMEELTRIEIALPRDDGQSEAFVKGKDRYWYFDTPENTQVNIKRWGGGIPLLLSGPGAERQIAENATEEKLAEFGLADPRMVVTLTLEDGEIMEIIVGDATPDRTAFYVQVPGSNDVAIVDISWYQVVERLVKEPPYPEEEE